MKIETSFITTTLHCIIISLLVGLIVTFILAGIAMLLSTFAQADTMDDTASSKVRHYHQPDEVKRGTLLFYGEEGFTSAPVLHMDVHTDVTGMIARARAHVKQAFRNPNTNGKRTFMCSPYDIFTDSPPPLRYMVYRTRRLYPCQGTVGTGTAEAAWAETLHDKKEVKAWPWEDTRPVSRLSVPSLGISRIVLAGANGSSLAFGPGHLFNSA
ncbi:MAG: hypothetical protein ACE5GZ_00200 [Gammaproteobacteria bacterium]